ncbi:MAG TPA: hypothetical protein VHM64_13125, partial [Candidatus Binatia bacterium]|nr:hypothetical protein [Candidatus Binatia bacterium]
CPYCKADLGPGPSPEWLIRDEGPYKTRSRVREKSVAPKVALAAGIILCIVAAALFGMGILGSGNSSATQGVLQQRNQDLQAREEQIAALEAELKKVRLENADIVKEAAALKTRLQEREKELTSYEQRLSVAKRETERAPDRRPQPERPTNPRPMEAATAPAPPAQRQGRAGVYETARATEVHERPAQSSRIITRLGGGTRINVVGGDGEWLEVVSKRGNPPGFVLRADAKLVSTPNK